MDHNIALIIVDQISHLQCMQEEQAEQELET
jgi:hypothetical protein